MVYYISLLWRGNVLNIRAKQVNVGDEITVKGIEEFDKNRTRVSLGLKQLGQDPWLQFNNHPVNSKINRLK